MKANLTALFVGLLLVPTIVMAQSTFTGGGDGTSWDDAANWDNGLPLFVNANIGDGFMVELDSDQIINELDLVGDFSSGMAMLNHTSGTLSTSGWFKIGVTAGNNGTYNMSGDAETNYGLLFVAANGGTANINLSGNATLSGGGLNAGLNADADVNITISDNASFEVADFNLGNCSLNQTGGQLVASSWVAISKDGGSGAYNISGGSLTQLPFANDWMSIGEGLDGSLNVSGDAIVEANANGMIVGRFDGGIGLLEITGSNATVDVQDLRVGIDDMGMDTTATGTLSWIADANGITPITSADNTEFGNEDSTLMIDLSASDAFGSYGTSGTAEEILLVENANAVSGTFAGIAEGGMVSIGGMKSGTISYSGGTDGNDIVLQVFVGGSKCEFELGDVNMDGTINLLDVAPFVNVLTGGGEYVCEADINQDGVNDLLDVSPFVEILTN